MTATELGYLSSVSSSIQTQLDSKISVNGTTIIKTPVLKLFGSSNYMQWQDDSSSELVSFTKTYNTFTKETYFNNNLATASCQLRISIGTNQNTAMLHNNGVEFYILFSNSTTYPSFNTLRPFFVNMATGILYSQNGQNFSGGMVVDNITGGTGSFQYMTGGTGSFSNLRFTGNINDVTSTDLGYLSGTYANLQEQIGSNTLSLDSTINSWTQSNSSQQNWQSICMSASGLYQSACVGNEKIYYSNDYGKNWNASNSPSSNWRSICMSASGQYQSACSFNSVFYNSNDYGKTWVLPSSYPSLNYWRSICMSSSGQYQSVCSETRSIFYSNDYGKNWNVSISLIAYWVSICMSASGQYQSACIYNSFIYNSNDYGKTWTQSTNSLSKAWSSICMSASGQYQSACTDSYIYYSNDYGKNWTQSNSPIAYWVSICMSASGQYQSACIYNSYTYNSNDYGKTWTSSNTSSMYSICMSASGQYRSACINNGYIYNYQMSLGPITTSSLSVSGNVSQGKTVISGSGWTLNTGGTPQLVIAGTSSSETFSGFRIDIPKSNGTQSCWFWNYSGGTCGFANNSTGGPGQVYFTLTNMTAGWTTYSDVRMKRNIKPISNCLDGLCNISVNTYTYINDENEGIGFLAQELIENGLEKTVSNSGRSEVVDGILIENILGYSHKNMIPYIVKGIQELNHKVKQQNDKIKTLEETIIKQNLLLEQIIKKLNG